MKIKKLFKTGQTGKLLKALRDEGQVIPLVIILLPLSNHSWFKLNDMGKQENYNFWTECEDMIYSASGSLSK